MHTYMLPAAVAAATATTTIAFFFGVTSSSGRSPKSESLQITGAGYYRRVSFLHVNLVNRFPSDPYLLHLFQKKLLGISGQGFYKVDVLPTSQPSVPKHLKEHKALILTSGLISSFLHPHEILLNQK